MNCSLRRTAARLGFTLMEVNLAIFIMAAGVLAMVSLYPLGYRESEQSREDVWSASEADRILNQLHAALSQRSISWDKWIGVVKNFKEEKGNWKQYCDDQNGWVPASKTEIKSACNRVVNDLKKIYSDAEDSKQDLNLDSKYVYAIVAQPGRLKYNGAPRLDYSRIAISLRISRNAGSLFSRPVYFTEVHFQGDQKREKGK